VCYPARISSHYGMQTRYNMMLQYIVYLLFSATRKIRTGISTVKLLFSTLWTCRISGVLHFSFQQCLLIGPSMVWFTGCETMNQIRHLIQLVDRSWSEHLQHHTG
jgi:hypothetical protein